MNIILSKHEAIYVARHNDNIQKYTVRTIYNIKCYYRLFKSEYCVFLIYIYIYTCKCILVFRKATENVIYFKKRNEIKYGRI